MSAPTIKTKVTADTVDFDQGMKNVKDGLKQAVGDMKKFGATVKTSGEGALKGLGSQLKRASAELKPLANGLVDVTSKMAKWGAASVAAAGAAGAAIVGTALSSIKELKNFAAAADLNVSQLQRGAFAAKTVGIETDKYADILKDVNDRVGDFMATGAGPMVDFFEQIGPKVGVTAAAFEGLNSEQSLALYISSLEKANVSQAEMTFYMEAIASDATRLVPLFLNNASAMSALQQEAKELGIGLSEIDVKQAMNAQSQLSKIGNIIKNELMAAVVELAPFITVIGKQMVTWFKDARKGGDGLANSIGNFALGIVDYVDSISTVFGYVGRTFDVIKGAVMGFVATLKIAVGAAMQIISSIIFPIMDSLLTTVQFVSNAFNDGFGNGIVNIMKRLNIAITEFVMYPIEKLFELMAQLPEDFGGNLFKASLKDIQAMRDNTAKMKSELEGDVIPVDIDTSTATGKLTATINTMKENLADTTSNIFGAGEQIVADGYNLGLSAGESLNQGFRASQERADGIRASITGALAKVGEERLTTQADDPTAVDKTAEGGQGGDAMKLGETAEAVDPIASFYAETEKLIEAQLSRFMSQDEITLSHYSTELDMLNQQLANKEITEEEHAKRVGDIRKKQADTNKKLVTGEMSALITTVASGSGKASKILQKFAIWQALVKGKQAAVDAWQAGMSTGGPWAPAVAAAYAGASILRTGSMISSLRSGGSSSGGAGGGGMPSYTPPSGGSSGGAGGGGESSPSQPSRIFNVEFSGSSSTSTQQTRNLLELINEQAGDNVSINLRGG